MKITRNILSYIAAAAVLAPAVTSCIYEEGDRSYRGRKDVMVLLNVNASEMMQTKAGEDPTPSESAISSVRVYAYNQSGKLIGYSDSDNSYVSEGKESFHMVLNVPNGQPTEEVDFYVVANEAALALPADKKLSDKMTVAQLQDIIYTPSVQMEGDFPMYAVLEDKVLNLNAGAPHYNEITGHLPGFLLTENINLELKRSLAKVEFYVAQKVKGSAAADLAAEDVRINIHGLTILKEGIMADSWLFEKAPATTAVAQDLVITPLADKVVNSIGADASQAVKTDSDNYTCIMGPHYFAENNAGAASWNAEAPQGTMVIRLTYSFGVGGQKTADIRMPKLLRNHYYKVFCLIEASGKVSLTIAVLPWVNTDDQTIVYDDHVDATQIGWTGGTESAGVFTYPSTGAGQQAVLSFTLPAMTGATWYATIKDGDIQDFAFADGKKMTSGPLDGSKAEVILTTLTNNYLSGGSKRVKVNLIVRTECGRNVPARFNGQDIEYVIIQNQI